jgi:NhaA family Na+:H+ antiporter
MITRVRRGIADFLKLEAAGGVLLIAAMALGLLCANSPVQGLYNAFRDMPITFSIGGLSIAKPALLWINDGLMAVFFFLIGLELKREVLEGELSRPGQAVLPAVAAIGGMVLPAGIYVLLNLGHAAALRGWAIPAATDIAFALGILSLLGSRVPLSLKVFLATLALFDDLGAIVIIAVFYTEKIHTGALFISAIFLVLLLVLNRRRVPAKTPYILCGIALWVAVLKSGIHATIAGVLLAMFIPLSPKGKEGSSPLHEFEHDLHPTVAFAIMPLFAFANSGISFRGMTWSSLLDPVPLGVAAGLFIGKQIGVFASSWIAIISGVAHPPGPVGWKALYGISALCGIGFTMSFFIGSLAFGMPGKGQMADERIGIIAGSLLSAVFGYMLLNRTLPNQRGTSG